MAVIRIGKLPELYEKLGREYKEGEIIYIEGERATRFYVIYKGKVNMIRFLPDKQRLINILYDGQTFGENCILDEARYEESAIAAIDGTKLISIPKKGMINLIEQNPSFAVDFIRLLTYKISEALHYLQIKWIPDSVIKIGEIILAHFDKFTGTKKLGIEEISSISGLKLEATKTSVEVLCSTGYVSLDDDKITILSSQNLRSYLLQLGRK